VTYRKRASLLFALACVSVPALSACGGGGDLAMADDSSLTVIDTPSTPLDPAAPPAVSPPESPPAVSPPPSPPVASPAAPPSPPVQPGDVRPVLFIEKNPDGASFLRVQEQAYDPFNGGAQRVIADQQKGPLPGVNTLIEGTQTTRISNVDVTEMKHGLTLQASGDVSIYDYTYTKFNGGGAIHGAAIKLGDSGRPTTGTTYIQRVVADGMQQPDATYSVSNNDFIGVERANGPIYVRDVTGKNFGDGGIDTKSPIYFMNATFDGAHRMVRSWGVEIVLVNSIVNGRSGHSQSWVVNPGWAPNDTKVRYYNTLWCMDSENPSASDPKCKSDPWVVESDGMSSAEALTKFIPLQSNPLVDVSPFFRSSIDEIVVEYSTDGRTWQTLTLANTGKAGSAPVGDTRYKLPLNLGDANYLFRASYRKMGGKIGATSEIIDEAGATQSVS
jgi:hypothetical protein